MLGAGENGDDGEMSGGSIRSLALTLAVTTISL
jgi:hypothetical protein